MLQEGVDKSYIKNTYKISDATIYRIQSFTSQDIVNMKKLNHNKKTRTSHFKYENINEYTLDFVNQVNQMSFPLSINLIKKVATKYALAHNVTKFKSSNGWIDKFQRRYNIFSRKISGESRSADKNAALEFSGKISEITFGYDEKDIFNFDESGLFWKQLPDRTLAPKTFKIEGLKQPKNRFSLLFGVSKLGEKMPVLIIGNSKNPRSFKNKVFDELKVKYSHNKSAWMTKDIFVDYFIYINDLMLLQNRKILVLLDNCSAHKVAEFSNVNFKFLPPNTTSLIQPLDQGIIFNFKLKYRELFLNSIYNPDPQVLKRNLNKFNPFDVVEHILFAWEQVKTTTIINCFQKLYSYGSKLQIPLEETELDSLQTIMSKVLKDDVDPIIMSNYFQA